MQQIERYGIIALLFLVVSIVVVALWDPDPGTTLGNNNTRTAAAEKRAPRELPLAQPATNQASNQNRNKAKDWTEQKSRQTQASKRPVATHRPSAPLDLGAQGEGRYRGRNNGAVAKPKSESPSTPAANEAKLINPGPSSLKREQTQPNAGSVRSTGRLTQAQRPNKQAKGGGTMLAGSTQRIANPRPIAASFNKQGSPASKPVASGKKYTVKAGDSLERIARSQLGSGQQWKNLAALNGITNPNMVRIGDVLALPVAVAGSSAKAAP
ncbi:MAG: nucleoid-associated protein YgaU, partial [Planctomycetota bacterium]